MKFHDSPNHKPLPNHRKFMSHFWCLNFEVAPTYLGNLCTSD